MRVINKTIFIMIAISVLLSLSGKGWMEGNASASSSSETVTRYVTADNSIIDYQGERDYNMGRVSSIRMKAYQHHVIIKFDTSGLLGQEVTDAKLIFYENNSTDLDHITISTIHADWNEGTSGGFATSEGGSCFNYASYSSNPQDIIEWAWPNSKFADVVYGNSYSLVNYSATQMLSDAQGDYYQWNVDPDLIAANIIGVSYGLSLFESSDIVSMNRTVRSKETSQKPYLVITTMPDTVVPGAITNLSATNTGVERGEVKLSWTTPQDAFAYRIKVSGYGFPVQTDIPRYLIPFAGTASDTEQVIIKDILTPGENYTFTVEALSRGGNSSGVSTTSADTSDIKANPAVNINIAPPVSVSGGYSSSGLDVWVIPATEKVLPDGTFVENLGASYKIGNSVFDGDKILLSSAKNEVVSFILALEAVSTAVSGISISANLTQNITSRMYRIGYINTAGGFMPEILYPYAGTFSTNMDENASAVQKVQQVLIELLISPNIAAGDYNLSLDVTDASAINFNIPIALHIWDFTLPDKPSFNLEMNDYGYPNYVATYNELQKTAQKDRAHINLLPYNQTGSTQMDMYLPSGRRMDEYSFNNITPGATTTYWDDFITAFDGIFSGSIFDSGLWQDTPITGFYLPFHESWPLKYDQYYVPGGRDAYTAFTAYPAYPQTFINLLSDFLSLTQTQGWNSAGFQVYLNNKKSYGYSPWILDEPVDFWDFNALRYYAELFDQGTVNKGPLDIKYRIDISRPQYHRNLLRNLVDLHVVGKAFFNYYRIINEAARREGFEVWNYGTANEVYNSNHNEEAWPLFTYALGARGILPWSSVKYGSQYLSGVINGDSQKRALYIVTSDSQTPQVYSTLRMKAFMRGEQDIEYLEAARQNLGLTEGQVSRMVLDTIGSYASIDINSNYVEDAGTIAFRNLTETEFYLLRTKTAIMIEGGSTTGDVNGDKTVDILDLQACVNHFLGTQDWGTSADVNGDGNVDVLDVQEIVNVILGV